MPASLRERVIEQLSHRWPQLFRAMCFGGRSRKSIHGIANRERLELSGREQFLLADEIADDMTLRAAPSAPGG